MPPNTPMQTPNSPQEVFAWIPYGLGLYDNSKPLFQLGIFLKVIRDASGMPFRIYQKHGSRFFFSESGPPNRGVGVQMSKSNLQEFGTTHIHPKGLEKKEWVQNSHWHSFPSACLKTLKTSHSCLPKTARLRSPGVSEKTSAFCFWRTKKRHLAS